MRNLRERLSQHLYLSAKQVVNLIGFSRSTLYRLEKEKLFPSRVAITAYRVGWRSEEVLEWAERNEEKLRLNGSEPGRTRAKDRLSTHS